MHKHESARYELHTEREPHWLRGVPMGKPPKVLVLRQRRGRKSRYRRTRK